MGETKGTTFILFRHVESEIASKGRCEGLLDSGISESGRAQLRDLFIPHSSYLPVTAIFSSPLLRATVVAEKLATELAVPLREVPQLRARGMGEFQDRPWAELASQEATLLARCFEQDDVAPRRGETKRQLETRVLSVVDSIASAEPGGRIVLVTHEEVIRVILDRYGVKWRHLGLEITHGSFTVAQVGPPESRVGYPVF